MNLHEYQSKSLFSEYHLPVPDGYICHSLDDINETLNSLSSALSSQYWVAKCQVHAGGRGKAGGVIRSNNLDEIRQFAKKWLGQNIVTYQTTPDGQQVNTILIEKSANIAKELYLAVVIDRSSQQIVVMASTEGGVDIEIVAERTPHMIKKVTIDLLTGASPYQGRDLAFQLGLSGNQVNQFSTLFINLVKLFIENDLMLAEVNPLVVTEESKLVCLDAKIVLDDNALFRHPHLFAMRDTSQEDVRESIAAEHGISYVSLNGNIGCMVNGAGLAMATMDIIKLYGGEPANFLDVGGGTTAERVKEAFKLILSDRNVTSILVNIFGGIVRCDLIAQGIIAAIKDIGLTVPVVVRLEGNNAEIARQMLASSQLNVISALSLTDAAQKISSFAK